jgi:hypothetical protein
MRARNSENFLAIDQPFPAQLRQVFIVKTIRDRNVDLIPPIIARLVATNQEDRAAPGIERIQRSQRPPFVLRSQ